VKSNYEKEENTYEVITGGYFIDEEYRDYKFYGEVNFNDHSLCAVSLQDGVHVIKIFHPDYRSNPDMRDAIWCLPVEGFLEAMQKAIAGSLPNTSDEPMDEESFREER
jgi:hypothetical protein